MKTGTKKIILAVALAVIVVGAFVEISEAARWRYHAFRRGWVTVWGTRNCRRVTWPLRYRQYVWYCRTISGYLPWWCNDWMVRHEWGWPCYNITWRKYVARPCPRSCWRKRWIMGPLDDYLVDYVPYHYSTTEFTLPSVGDPCGHQTGNQEIYIFVDLGEWLDGTVGAGSPYEPVPPGTDPNTIYYDFSTGVCPDLPGYTVMRVTPDVCDVGSLIVFNPDADPCDYPFENTRPDLLFNGRLYLESEHTFTSEEYNGYLMTADSDMDGIVNFNDFVHTAGLWLADVNTAGPIE